MRTSAFTTCRSRITNAHTLISGSRAAPSRRRSRARRAQSSPRCAASQCQSRPQDDSNPHFSFQSCAHRHTSWAALSSAWPGRLSGGMGRLFHSQRRSSRPQLQFFPSCSTRPPSHDSRSAHVLAVRKRSRQVHLASSLGNFFACAPLCGNGSTGTPTFSSSMARSPPPRRSLRSRPTHGRPGSSLAAHEHTPCSCSSPAFFQPCSQAKLSCKIRRETRNELFHNDGIVV